jgi:hypothetical protein
MPLRPLLLLSCADCRPSAGVQQPLPLADVVMSCWWECAECACASCHVCAGLCAGVTRPREGVVMPVWHVGATLTSADYLTVTPLALAPYATRYTSDQGSSVPLANLSAPCAISVTPAVHVVSCPGLPPENLRADASEQKNSMHTEGGYTPASD